MMHGVFILHTIISSVARNGNTGRTFSQRTLYTIQRISIPPHCHFERSEKSFSSPFSTTPSLSRLREAPPTAFPAIRCFPFLAAKHAPSYRQRKRSLGSARDDDTGKMLSKHSLCRICWIRASPYHVKKPRQEPELFCIRKTYLPNCASMVPAATAVPITPATFGPIACISR